jgi:hypothetical protein
VGGGPSRAVAATAAQEIHPTFSAAGDEVLWVEVGDGHSRVLAAPFRDGVAGATTWRFETQLSVLSPRVSPAGDWLAFVGDDGQPEVWIVSRRVPSPAPLRLTTGAGALDVAWQSATRVVASGRWGLERLSLRSVGLDGSVAPFRPWLDLGPPGDGGRFGYSAAADVLAVTTAARAGDIWLMDTAQRR